MNKLSVIFAGTGRFGAPVLEKLLADKRFEISFVITGQDKKAGRGLEITFSPVKQVALTNKLIVHQPGLISELSEKIAQTKPDFLLVVSYGELIDKEILDLPRLGSINIHGSLLPKYRGASPIHEAILSGDSVTGVTWIKMNEKMDRGDIIAQKEVEINENDYFHDLHDKLQACAAQNTGNALYDFAVTGQQTAQDNALATYCKKIKKENGILNPFGETAEQMMRKIRAYSEWPGCVIKLGGRKIKIIQADVGEQKNSSGREIGPGEIYISNSKILAIGTQYQALFPTRVQPEGKRAMNIDEYLRGNKAA